MVDHNLIDVFKLEGQMVKVMYHQKKDGGWRLIQIIDMNGVLPERGQVKVSKKLARTAKRKNHT